MKMNRPCKVLIADDDPLISSALAAMVRDLEPHWKLLPTAHDHASLIRIIESEIPDILLLDLHMPSDERSSGDSLRALETLSHRPAVIVITGDPTRALAAYENSVIDYLVKPVPPARLRRALQRASHSLEVVTHPTVAGATTARPWLSAHRGDDIVIVRPEEIIYLQADRRNTRVMLADGEAILRCGISEIERGLTQWYLLRIHRGTIVNLQHVKYVRRDELGRLRIHLIGSADRLVVSRPFEVHFRSGISAS